MNKYVSSLVAGGLLLAGMARNANAQASTQTIVQLPAFVVTSYQPLGWSQYFSAGVQWYAGTQSFMVNFFNPITIPAAQQKLNLPPSITALESNLIKKTLAYEYVNIIVGDAASVAAWNNAVQSQSQLAQDFSQGFGIISGLATWGPPGSSSMANLLANSIIGANSFPQISVGDIVVVDTYDWYNMTVLGAVPMQSQTISVIKSGSLSPTSSLGPTLQWMAANGVDSIDTYDEAQFEYYYFGNGSGVPGSMAYRMPRY